MFGRPKRTHFALNHLKHIHSWLAEKNRQNVFGLFDLSQRMVCFYQWYKILVTDWCALTIHSSTLKPKVDALLWGIDIDVACPLWGERSPISWGSHSSQTFNSLLLSVGDKKFSTWCSQRNSILIGLKNITIIYFFSCYGQPMKKHMISQELKDEIIFLVDYFTSSLLDKLDRPCQNWIG